LPSKPKAFRLLLSAAREWVGCRSRAWWTSWNGPAGLAHPGANLPPLGTAWHEYAARYASSTRACPICNRQASDVGAANWSRGRECLFWYGIPVLLRSSLFRGGVVELASTALEEAQNVCCISFWDCSWIL